MLILPSCSYNIRVTAANVLVSDATGKIWSRSLGIFKRVAYEEIASRNCLNLLSSGLAKAFNDSRGASRPAAVIPACFINFLREVMFGFYKRRQKHRFVARRYQQTGLGRCM